MKSIQDQLRSLPSVDAFLKEEDMARLLERYGREALLREIRRALAYYRGEIQKGRLAGQVSISELAEKIRRLRLHGMTSDPAARYGSRYRHWDVERVGWKYNMDDIHAALLVRQIDRLDRNWERRSALAERYRKALRGLASVQIPEIRGKGAHHLQTIWVRPEIRDETLHGLQEQGVGVAVNYRALHTLQYFRKTFGYKESDYPVAFEIGTRTLSLPLYTMLEDSEVDYVVECVRETLVQIQ